MSGTGAADDHPEIIDVTNEVPAATPAFRHSKEQHRQKMNEKEAKTRDALAIGIVGIIALYNLLLIIGLLTDLLDVDDLVRTVGALSGVQTLGAAVAGFYFARGRKNK